VVVGQPVSLLVHTQDRFGNSRAAGGDDVDVELSGPAGKLSQTSRAACHALATVAHHQNDTNGHNAQLQTHRCSSVDIFEQPRRA